MKATARLEPSRMPASRNQASDDWLCAICASTGASDNCASTTPKTRWPAACTWQAALEHSGALAMGRMTAIR